MAKFDRHERILSRLNSYTDRDIVDVIIDVKTKKKFLINKNKVDLENIVANMLEKIKDSEIIKAIELFIYIRDLTYSYRLEQFYPKINETAMKLNIVLDERKI